MVLLVAKPGNLRKSLQSLLETVSETVRVVDDVPSAVEAILEHRPALAFIHTNRSGGGGLAMLPQVKAQVPECRVLVLTEDTQQQLDAVVAGADVVLPMGYPPAELFGTIKQVLSEQLAQA
jgi:two-component system response regulator DesR